MPVYEFRCNQCRRKSSHFFRSFSDTRRPACTNCGSADLVRVMRTLNPLPERGDLRGRDR